jgi:hypothetical protein
MNLEDPEFKNRMREVVASVILKTVGENADVDTTDSLIQDAMRRIFEGNHAALQRMTIESEHRVGTFAAAVARNVGSDYLRSLRHS